MTKADALRRMLLIWLPGVAASVAGCHSFREELSDGPGMILVYGSVINGRSIAAKSAVLPDGKPFMEPGAISGGIKKGQTWRNVPTSTMGASGDHRGLPEWVDFAWQEPEYPGKKPEDIPNREAFASYVKEKYARLPVKTQRLEIKRRVPQAVVDEVVASKRAAQPGQRANKTLWIYFFWTPDGMKMRWEMTNRAAGPGGFGPVVKDGGDDLDRYNL
ncbi:MAG: hypothetical protein WAQ08_02675 [Aquabacterium sp.]|uniref:hypothetical protein n=1 Tax=Aquabacterium sp. TaxID=1872578 RepID=UPI003BB156A8